MNKLSDLINKLCPNGVEYKTLEKCCNILDNMRKPITKSAREKGNYPYYGANGIQDYVSNYIFDGKFILVGEDGSVINRNGNPIVTWAEGKIWVNNHAHIIEEIEGIQLRYLYYYIQTINVANLIHGNIPKLNQGDFRKLRIAVPPMEIQLEIVRILDKFTKIEMELEFKLETELEARKKQYEYYRNKLLNFDETANPCGCTHTHTHTHGYFYRQRIEYIKLKDIAEIGTGSSNTNEELENGKYPFFVRSPIVRYKNDYEYDEKAIITSGDGVGVGKIFHLINGKYALHQRAYRIHIINVEFKTEFIYYYMKAKFYKYIKEKSFHSSVTSIRRPMLNDFLVPKISIEEQERIVKILDKFEKICNDILEGLPAEIEARQQQYEYYRDKILTFKELENE